MVCNMTAPRLPWQPHPEGGFIAYPEGWKEQPDRYGRITIHTATSRWSWSVNYDGQAVADIAETKQAASDAANEAWPRVIELARVAGGRTEWERNTLEMIEKAKLGEIGPHYFANEAATYENMMWVMDRIRPKPYAGPIAAGLQRVVDALSAEFFRRRSR
jgi:hypothetical protein